MSADRIREAEATGADTLAVGCPFCMMMIRLGGCMACETDSYRAMKGCLGCALQTLRRYKGPDEELVQRYQESLMEIEKHLELLPVAPVFIPARAA